VSARAVRKATVWSEAEWTHVDAQARKQGVPPLRFVPILGTASTVDLELIEWAVAAFQDAFSGLIQRVEARGVAPPPRVVMSLIEPLISGLQVAVGCAPSSSHPGSGGDAEEGIAR
jgi:hypothetical protein